MTALVEHIALPAHTRSVSLRRSRSLRAKRQHLVLRGLLITVDVVALMVAVGGASLLRAALDDVLPVANLALEWHLTASAVAVPILLLMFLIQGLYDFERILRGSWEYARIAHSVTYGIVVILAASYFAGGGPLFSRSWLLLLWLLCILFAGFGR